MNRANVWPVFLAMSVLGTAACASKVVRSPVAHVPAEPAAVLVPASPEASPSPASIEPIACEAAAAGGRAVETADEAGVEAFTCAELDAAPLFAAASVHDPWEGFNRKMHRFNGAADRFVLRPVAVGYRRVAPEPVRAGVSRFFANLSLPATAMNQILQGRPGDAGRSLGRFVVNTTVGMAGLFDPSTSLGMTEPDEEDFGQTLATWGWRRSRYVVLPLLGPATIRDTIGVVGDQPLSPLTYVSDSATTNALLVLGIADRRAGMLPLDAIRGDAFDDYLFVRDAWSQRRKHRIEQNLRSGRD